MTSAEIFCRRLRPEVSLPRYHSEQAAGLDLQAWPSDGKAQELLPGHRILVSTGLALAIPFGFEGQVRPRSGWALRHGITVLNSPGTVDSDYRGELLVLLINLGDAPVTIHPGDRIAQLVIAPVVHAKLQEVVALDETSRGSGGYGHTGK